MSCQFADEIIELHKRLRYPGLPDSVGRPIFRFEGNDGLITISARQSQLSDRYLRAVMGFRLAKFLEIGFMDKEIVRQRALYYEPVSLATGPETIHALTLTETGRFAGYMALVGTPDPTPMPFGSPVRGRFPAEVAHGVDLLRGFNDEGWNTHQVYEIKRMVRDPALPPGEQSERVPWHLVLALGASALELGVRCVLGDARETGALRHVKAIGIQPIVINDTRPSLPRTELMWPSYAVPEPAKPFVGAIPDDLADYLGVIRSALSENATDGWRRRLVKDLLGVRIREQQLVGAGTGAA